MSDFFMHEPDSWIEDFLVSLSDDVIVRMNPLHTFVVKNSGSPLYDEINLDRLSFLYRKVFTHKTGFMTVLDIPVLWDY